MGSILLIHICFRIVTSRPVEYWIPLPSGNVQNRPPQLRCLNSTKQYQLTPGIPFALPHRDRPEQVFEKKG